MKQDFILIQTYIYISSQYCVRWLWIRCAFDNHVPHTF